MNKERKDRKNNLKLNMKNIRNFKQVFNNLFSDSNRP